jgi:hypothetical protein
MNSKTKLILTITGLFFFMAGVIYFQSRQLRSVRVELVRVNQNVKALADDVRITETKNGEAETNRYALLLTKVSELENLNKSLYEEVKKTKGSVTYISNIMAGIKGDTGKVPTVITNSPTGFEISFNADKTYSEGNFRKLKGFTKVGVSDTSTFITEDQVNLTATTGLKKNEKGDYEIFFRSPYPGLSVEKLEGAYIPKASLSDDFKTKKKRFGFGLNVGYSPLAYDLNNKKLEFKNQITAGVGITYKF